MSDAVFDRPATRATLLDSPRLRRAVLLVAVSGGLAAGLAATDGGETARAVAAWGDDLTRLLRFMALAKSTMALAAIGTVAWRLGSPASFLLFTSYALAGAAMASGPALIWDMAHVGLGALLLHGGLAGCLVLLWRDPAVAARLSAAVAARCRSGGPR